MRIEEVFEELLETLERMGIEPIGALEKLPTLVEHREWLAPLTNKENGFDEVMFEAEPDL
jgi:hypothetical protein